jgi:DNA polymerase-3 subunit delta'
MPTQNRSFWPRMRANAFHTRGFFTGPEGVGKATLAYRFARFLFKHPLQQDDAGLFGDAVAAPTPDRLFVAAEDPVFRRVASGAHGGLFTLQRELNDKGKLSQQIRVDDVRAAIDFAHKTSGEEGFKVIIVDGAEYMNASSENAFLKVLEEPPASTVILLVSHNPGRLLPTTRSRCRTLALKPLALQTIVELLKAHMPDTSETDARELARLADGSLGRALSMAENDGLAIYHDIRKVLTDLPALNLGAVQKLAGRLSKAGADAQYRTGVDLFRWWLSRIVLAASRGAKGDTTLTEGERDVADRAAATAILPIWLQRLDEAESLIRSADSLNLDRHQVILSLFMSLELDPRGS